MILDWALLLLNQKEKLNCLSKPEKEGTWIINLAPYSSNAVTEGITLVVTVGSGSQLLGGPINPVH
jgi:hypothetical protein